ncbi:hypothetical protein SCP_0116260 [Sparassis crispa]|uniref:Uncharacterized protein n=1 Tax=Sparassis crispa TaxID=139825 RepID=A0A401G991_9APHY|nr:hypothetical protein SCP_0116260 [Sparassis crispa]GBE78735.1 hypothetical protein SCP_0116260 [Sparassis crispa]
MESYENCVCGRSFSQSSAFSHHQRACQKAKKRLSDALHKAKETWSSRKKRRLEISKPAEAPASSSNTVLVQPTQVGREDVDAVNLMPPVPEVGREDVDDSNLSLLERRPWSRRLNRRLPRRFRDLLPEPAPSLPPSSVSPHKLSSLSESTSTSLMEHPVNAMSPQSHSAIESLAHRIQGFLMTPHNKFGLFRRYWTNALPSHDPEELLSLEDLSESPGAVEFANDTFQRYFPYPNATSFRLGDWYWNGGVQKSQSSFKALLDIIGDPEYDPADVRAAHWDDINRQLASDQPGEWADDDAGWNHTPVTISVPYHRRRGVSMDPQNGPKDYTVVDFHHRSLCDIIREKISNPVDALHFHYEPFQLLWQPGDVPNPIQVHGELYTSPAFIESHRELQDSPPELGCDLQRVVVAMMFWSDATHLTSFGNAKLCPLYLFFGNESKYHRCKPSRHLCNHVAYFQSVCIISLIVN